VRVVSVGVPVKDLLAEPDKADWINYSIEFCGGTHLEKTGDAEGFIIIAEEAVAKGVRRITALTGQAAHGAAAQGEMLLARLDALRKNTPQQLCETLAEFSNQVSNATLPLLVRAKLRDGIGELQKIVKEYQKKQSKEAAGNVTELARKIADQSNGPIIVTTIDGADANALRTAMDVIRKKQPEAALLLGAVNGDKVSFVAAVPKMLVEQGLKAGDWVREVAKVAGGGGGGRPDMAQAGGKDPAKLEEALEVGRTFAQNQLESGLQTK